MTHLALTRLEKSTLERLKELHAKHPANDWGFWASSLGASKAAAARRMEHTGLIKIDRQAGNCFRYALTDTGKARIGQ
jgi:hypothetical protein